MSIHGSHSEPVRRRTLLKAGGATVAAGLPLAGATEASAGSAAQGAARVDTGVSAYPFPLSAVRLLPGRLLDNTNRTLTYLSFLDLDRMLHIFRLNYGLSSNAQAVGGWDAPSHDLRGHTTGHLMTALAQAYASTGNAAWKTRGDYLVSTLASCQSRATSRGFGAGYLSAFPESFFDRVETAQRVQAPYYTIHKILAGLLDMHLLAGNAQALTVALALAGWVRARTARLDATKLANTQNSEYGGIGEALINLYQLTGDVNHLTTARRFVKPTFTDPLASHQDSLRGRHANTHLPTALTALRDYHASGSTRNRDIATNFWDILTTRYTYAIGGSSQNEFWRDPNQIAATLTDKNCEGCCTYNTLRLTRQLFFTNPARADLFDYYEHALFNHILAQQDPTAANGGGYAYFIPLRAGGIKTYSTDYSTFSCCQGTGMESNTKYTDSIYAYAGETLYWNLFVPSELRWPGRAITIRQDTTFPSSFISRLTVTGAGHIALKVRVPSWTTGLTVKLNGTGFPVTATPGTYLTIDRTWASGDTVEVTIRAALTYPRANDDASVGSVRLGPILLVGEYGATDLGGVLPTLRAGSLVRDTSEPLHYTATTTSGNVSLRPMFSTHHQRYAAYWRIA
ncbi:beta-L-arabinofuranosidase domain-containing protein [Micromonospora sp. 067-2]|uniref:beta-L-arabinofuranosidase domain-containing protein n=1 Tax=Micromonospora sp. 067-2 TaxID=2789270 RepID=UPI00397AC754